jgi:perosamine synthetase
MSGTAYIPQMQPWIGEEEKKAVVEYLDSGGWLTEFTRTRDLEQAIAAYVGGRHVAMVMNGTVSLFAALAALGVGAGHEVLVPDLTMIASANTVLLAGATPVFVDVDPSTLCLDLEQAERHITERTKAIMLVSFNGRAPDMERAVALARRHRLFLVEDAAQALGSRWRGRHLGTFGDIGSFSFSSPKVITMGQGGALVTDDDALMARVLKVKDFGRVKAGVDEHDALGYNFKFTDLQAVIGLAQMAKLDWRVQRKKEIFARYRAELADVREVAFVATNLEETSPWFIDVLVPDPRALRQHLHERGIGTRPFYPPVHTQAPYHRPGSFPETERASRQGLWLPSSSFLEDGTVKRICGEIRAFYRPRA